MATRLLKDWTNSTKVNKLTPKGERFFTRLIMKSDDFGNFYGNTSLLKSYLFPLKNELTLSEIEECIKECISAKLINVYEVDDKPYINIYKFGQRLRSMKGKFPEPNSPSATDNGRLEVEEEVEVELEEKLKQELPFGELFSEAWAIWISYRKSIKKNYKSFESEKAALKSLAKYSEEFVIVLIERSMANSWQGLIYENTEKEFKKFIANGTASGKTERTETISNLKNLAERILENYSGAKDGD